MFQFLSLYLFLSLTPRDDGFKFKNTVKAISLRKSNPNSFLHQPKICLPALKDENFIYFKIIEADFHYLIYTNAVFTSSKKALFFHYFTTFALLCVHITKLQKIFLFTSCSHHRNFTTNALPQQKKSLRLFRCSEVAFWLLQWILIADEYFSTNQNEVF